METLLLVLVLLGLVAPNYAIAARFVRDWRAEQKLAARHAAWVARGRPAWPKPGSL